MKKILLLILVVGLTNNPLFSQIQPVPILLEKTEDYVRSYFNSLKTMFPNNRYVVIEESTTKSGDLKLTFETPTLDEEKTASQSISCVFIRTDNKQEVCISQSIFGTDISSYANLKHIKDTYEQSDVKNKWFKKSTNYSTINLVAEFLKKDDIYYIQHYISYDKIPNEN